MAITARSEPLHRPVQDGLSGDQQFFLAFAQNWGTKTRDAALRQQVMTDPHAPGEYRSPTVRNIDAWYAAFNVQAGAEALSDPGGARANLVSVASSLIRRRFRQRGGRSLPCRQLTIQVPDSRSVIPITRGCEAAD